MKRIILIVVIAILTIFVAFGVFFVFAIRPIDRTGYIDTAKNNINSQIAKAVGRGEVTTFSSLLEFIQYPEVSEYKLERNKNFDHDVRNISFKTKNLFDRVLAFYQEKFPASEPTVKTRGGNTEVYQYDENTQKTVFQKKYVKPFQTAKFRIQTKPGRTGRSFFFFTTQESELYFRIDITENAEENLIFVVLTN